MALKASRSRAREIALQALYAWQLAGADAVAEAHTLDGWERCDQAFAEDLIRGVIRCAEQLEQRITPVLDREFRRLSPVERAILCIGAYELAERADTPFKVVINEAIELGKVFGGTGGHKYVNGVLEKLAAELRPQELAVARHLA
jgi:N utilization substance protein B